MKNSYSLPIGKNTLSLVVLFIVLVGFSMNTIGQTLIPFSGNNSVPCGTNTTLCTHAGLRRYL